VRQLRHSIPLVVFFVSVLALVAAAGEEPVVKAVTSSLGIEFHGRLKADMSYDDSSTYPGEYILWVNQEHTGRRTTNDDEFNMTARETRLWFIFKGPQMGPIRTGGKVEFDFEASNAPSNKAKLMLRRAYIEADWRDLGLTLLAGQHSDVFSPLYAYTLNYTVGWQQGNIGYRRPQVRLSKRFDCDGFGLDLAGALARTVGGETLSGIRSDYGEDSGLPVLEGRIGLRLPCLGTKQMNLGVSGHWGKEQVDISDGANKNIETYSINLDAKLPIDLEESIGPFGLQFELSGELFFGQNLDNYMGGIGQGINSNTWKGIKTAGGWGQIAYLGIKKWRFVVGGGIDNPYSRQVPAGGRVSNMWIFCNAVHNLTRHLQVGVEYTYAETGYVGPNGTDNRVQFSMIYNF